MKPVTTYDSGAVTRSLTLVFFCKALTRPKKFSVLDLLAAKGGYSNLYVTNMPPNPGN